MALVIFTGTYLTAAAIHWTVMALARGRLARIFRGVSAALLSPLGTIFALLVAFIAAQVWSDVDRAKVAVSHEASALRTVVLLAASFPGEPEARLRGLIARHIDEAVSDDWPRMAEQSATMRVAPPALSEALQFTVTLEPGSQGQITAQRQIVTAREEALDARRQRIIVSRSSVNWVKWACLLAQAVCTLAAIAIVHHDSRGAAVIAMGIFATGVAVSLLLIASHDRPFTGEISIKPDLLQQARPDDTQRR